MGGPVEVVKFFIRYYLPLVNIIITRVLDLVFSVLWVIVDKICVQDWRRRYCRNRGNFIHCN